MSLKLVKPQEIRYRIDANLIIPLSGAFPTLIYIDLLCAPIIDTAAPVLINPDSLIGYRVSYISNWIINLVFFTEKIIKLIRNLSNK